MTPPERSALPDTVCPLPWLNLSTDVNGSTRPCCKFAQPSPDSGYQLTNMRDGDLDEVWNGEAMQRLRRDFRNGVQPAECSSCWDEEAAGIASFRQTYLAHRGITTPPDYDDVAPPQPAALDLKLTNVCNLKCRICGPVASSLWLREELAVGGDDADPYLVDNKDYFRANKITHDPVNREIFQRWVGGLDHLELTGGEPMLSRENREILEMIVADGRAGQMTLLLTTNGAVVDERILAHLPAFAMVVLTLSIDDIGGRFEYERAPASWAQTEANLARYASMTSDRLLVSLNCSVSPLNAWYLPDLVDWLVASEHLGAVHLNLNLVHYPRHYNLQAMPPALKDSTRRHLARRQESAHRPWPPDVRAQVDELVEFMGGGGGDEAHEWQEFLRVTAGRDFIRGESFAATFPELAAEIERVEATTAPSAVPRPGGGRGVSLRFPRRRRRYTPTR